MFNLRDDRVSGRVQPAGIVAGPKVRRDVLFDDAPRERIRDRRLQPVTDFDPNLSLLDEDEEDQAVVVLLVADLPALGAADREVFEHFPTERGKDVDDELRAGGLLELRELVVERLGLRGIEQGRLIGVERGGRRRDVEGKRDAGDQREDDSKHKR